MRTVKSTMTPRVRARGKPRYSVFCWDFLDNSRDGIRSRLSLWRFARAAMVLCLESATPIENELDRIDVLYGLGIRSIGICYSESNMLGGARDHDMGLTDFGYDAVKRMNKIGILIDRARANNRTLLETIEAITI